MRNRIEKGAAVEDLLEDGIDRACANSLQHECHDRLDEIEAVLIHLCDGGADIPQERVGRVLNAFHGLKDALDYLHSQTLNRLCQMSEWVLHAARYGNLKFSAAHAEVLLAAVVRMKQMISSRVRVPGDEVSAEIESLNAILKLSGNSVPTTLGGAAELTVARVVESHRSDRRRAHTASECW